MNGKDTSKRVVFTYIPVMRTIPSENIIKEGEIPNLKEAAKI